MSNVQNGLGSDIGHRFFVGWVESGGLGFSTSGEPTYLPAIFVLSAKPNKMADGTILPFEFRIGIGTPIEMCYSNPN
jgi:hypothetical protein